MSKTIPLMVTLLMIFSGLAGAIVPVAIAPAHDTLVQSATVVQERSVEPMLWNGSDNAKYDYQDADLSVTPNLVTGNMSGSAHIVVKALKVISNFNFTLLGAYKVIHVKDGSLNNLVYKQNTTLNKLTVNLSGPASIGQALTVVVDYAGQVNRSVNADNCNWTAGVLLQRETPWYPMPPFSYGSDVRSRDLDRHNLTVHVLVPGNWTVVSVGTSVSKITQGPNLNYTFKSIDAVDGATVAAANYTINTTVHNGVTLTTYLFKDNATRSGRFMTRAINILDWLAGKFGVYPYPTLRMIEVNNNIGGLESDQTLVVTNTFGSTIPPLDLTLGISDQYFLYSTAPIGNYDAWLTWSLSEYITVYYQLAVDGKNDRLRNHHFAYGGGTGEQPIKDIKITDNKFKAVINHKGPYVLHMLRYLVGNTTFDSIIQSYLASAHGKNATIDDFFSAVKQETSTDLTWFFDQWLNTTQALDYSVTSLPSLMYQEGNLMKIEFTVSKVGGAAMPGDIGLDYFSGNPTTMMAKLLCHTCTSKTTDANITEDVSEVVFDPDMWLLDVNKDNDKSTPIKEDLSVTSLTLDPDTAVTENDDVTITTIVKNVGADPQDMVVTFYDNGTPIAAKSVQNLAVGAQTPQSTTWTAVKGSHNISVFADSDQVIKEYNESNNRRNVTLEVAKYIAPPDLKFVGAVTLSKAKVTEGELVAINATVYNDYELDLSGINVDFLIDGALLSNVNLPTVKANSTANVTDNWASTAGSHVIKAVIHPPSSLTESNPDNNAAEVQVTINAIPTAILDVDNDNPFSGVEIELSGTSSTDDNGIALYKFSFGDGAIRNWSDTAKARHTYKYPGNYSATLWVKDLWGIESPESDPHNIRVKDTQPTATFDIFPTDSGNVYTVFSFKPVAKDPDGNVTQYVWDFGDQKTTNEKEPTHKYTKAGTFEVRLAVIDNSGESSIPVTQPITIKNLKPNVYGTVSATDVKVNDPVTLDASNTWDPDNDKGDLTFKWTSNGRVLSSKIKDANVRFSLAGKQDITLTVTDPAKATNSTSFTINVTALPVTPSDGDNGNNNMMLYAGAGGGAAALIVILGLFFFMRSKKAKTPKEEDAAKPAVKKVKTAKPEAKPTKPAPKEEEKLEVAKEPGAVKEEAPKVPPKKPVVEAPKPEPKPEAPKPKVVKKPAPKPAAPKPVAKPPEKKPVSVHEKAKKAAEDEWEK